MKTQRAQCRAVSAGVETVWYLPPSDPADPTSEQQPPVPQRLAVQARVMAAQDPSQGGEVIALLQSPVRCPTLASAPLSGLLCECRAAGGRPVDDTSGVWSAFWGDHIDPASCWEGASGWSMTSLPPPTRIYPKNLYGEVVHYISVPI